MHVLKTTGMSSWGEVGYYTGKMYIHQGANYVVTDADQKVAKQYTSKARAERAAYALKNKVGVIFEVEDTENMES